MWETSPFCQNINSNSCWNLGFPFLSSGQKEFRSCNSLLPQLASYKYVSKAGSEATFHHGLFILPSKFDSHLPHPCACPPAILYCLHNFRVPRAVCVRGFLPLIGLHPGLSNKQCLKDSQISLAVPLSGLNQGMCGAIPQA